MHTPRPLHVAPRSSFRCLRTRCRWTVDCVRASERRSGRYEWPKRAQPVIQCFAKEDVSVHLAGRLSASQKPLILVEMRNAHRDAVFSTTRACYGASVLLGHLSTLPKQSNIVCCHRTNKPISEVRIISYMLAQFYIHLLQQPDPRRV